jgi:hypothetical protein
MEGDLADLEVVQAEHIQRVEWVGELKPQVVHKEDL